MARSQASRRALLVLTAVASVSAARTDTARDRLRFGNAADRVRGAIVFRFWPDQGGMIHAIIYLEPQDARNEIALTCSRSPRGTRRSCAPAPPPPPQPARPWCPCRRISTVRTSTPDS